MFTAHSAAAAAAAVSATLLDERNNRSVARGHDAQVIQGLCLASLQCASLLAFLNHTLLPTVVSMLRETSVA